MLILSQPSAETIIDKFRANPVILVEIRGDSETESVSQPRLNEAGIGIAFGILRGSFGISGGFLCGFAVFRTEHIVSQSLFTFDKLIDGGSVSK